jgi:peptide/nickel transport system ATP-binding protein
VLLPGPALLLADEPTTALDNIVQKEVLDTIVEMTRALGTAVILITHDLSLAAQYADEVAVMYQGRIVESGPTRDILRCPTHERTRALLRALPRPRSEAMRVMSRGPPLFEARNVVVDHQVRRRWFSQNHGDVRAVCGVSLTIFPGETLALVGESGSGKTTLGRALLRLVRPTSGAIFYQSRDLAALDAHAFRPMRRKLQLIFQDPYSSLDPRMRVTEIVREGLRHEIELTATERAERVSAILRDVEFPAECVTRFPHELSGGQRQRVCIARALVMRPEFVVADEPVAALDLSVQAQVLALLESLKAKIGFTCLFISHDLTVVEQLSDRVAVMRAGRLVELGSNEQVFTNPQHPYTRRLLAARPKLSLTPEGDYRLHERVMPASAPPPGRWFAGTSERAQATEGDEFLEVESGHLVLFARRD